MSEVGAPSWHDDLIYAFHLKAPDLGTATGRAS
jgi:hypothetical protein